MRRAALAMALAAQMSSLPPMPTRRMSGAWRGLWPTRLGGWRKASPNDPIVQADTASRALPPTPRS